MCYNTGQFYLLLTSLPLSGALRQHREAVVEQGEVVHMAQTARCAQHLLH